MKHLKRKYILILFCVAGWICAAAVFGAVCRYSGNSAAAASHSTQISDTQDDVKKVALTFDDGPDPDYTSRLLKGLKERNVRVTFFVLGEQAKEYPQLLREMAQDGHRIGCHGYDHTDLRAIPFEEACRQMEDTADVVEKVTGQRPLVMRPPFGWSPQGLEEAVEMAEVLWTVDTKDWSLRDSGRITDETLDQVQDGSIILMHDVFGESVDAALTLADELKKRGFAFVTAEELIFE